MGQGFPHKFFGEAVSLKDVLEVLQFRFLACGVTNPVGSVPHTS